MRVAAVVSPADRGHSVELRLDDRDGELLTARELDSPPASPLPLERALARIEGRSGAGPVHAGDVAAVGRHLFDWLLGEDGWRAITTAVDAGVDGVELALWLPRDDLDLGRLPWEAMHDGAHFLGGHPDVCVAVTRVVADATVACGEPIPAPARVLFAVADRISHPRMRPGAEVLGLLRAAEHDDRGAIGARVLERTSIAGLTSACKRFDPHVVHFIGHGYRDEQERGVLELQPSEDHDGEATADDLILALSEAPSLPAVVLLTGCESGASGEHVDSLAAQLVRLGIPHVVGMAGRITNPVCRMFARRFAIALARGEPLVAAMAHGRRAALLAPGGNPEDDPSWTYPSIFVAPSTPVGHAPIDASGASAAHAVQRDYDLHRDPVFCGRHDLVALFQRLLDRDDPLTATIVYSGEPSDPNRKLGLTRAQHELAAMALRSGHLVVLIDDDGNDDSMPKRPLELAARLAERIADVRTTFGLGPPDGSLLLEAICQALGRSPDLNGDDAGVRALAVTAFLAECRGNDLPPIAARALRQALADDLARLIADARASADLPSIGDSSQAIVVAGGLEDWDTAGSMLLEELLDVPGLGTKAEPVPLLAVGRTAATIVPALRRLRLKSWAEAYEIRPLARDDEASLAYQWLLTHPRPSIDSDHAQYVYTPGERDGWEDLVHDAARGYPGNFDNVAFYATVWALTEASMLVAYEDTVRLDSYEEALVAQRGAGRP